MLAQKQEVRSRNPNFDKINESAEAFCEQIENTINVSHTYM